MKKQYLMLASALLLAGAAQAQGTELFFSEYAEGAQMSGTNLGGTTPSAGNERGLEIFNPTNDDVDLTPYSVRRYSNGNSSITEEERVFRSNSTYQPVGTNTLLSNDAFVMICGQATHPDLIRAANQYSAPHAPSIGAAFPNVLVGGGTIYFSGNDAVALVRYPSGTAGQGNGVIIDLIGVIGEDPLNSQGAVGGTWNGRNSADLRTDPIIGASPARDTTYTPLVSTSNMTIQRRPNVSAGVRSTNRLFVVGSNPPVRNANGYDPSVEWFQYSTAYPVNDPAATPAQQKYDQFGTHNYTGTSGAYQTTLSNALGKFDAAISVYPNPAHGTATVDIKDAKVGSVVLINNLGQRIMGQAKGTGQEQIKLDVSSLKAGLYFVQIVSADGGIKIYKELVVQ